MSETVDIRELNDLIASKSSFVNMITQGMDQVIVGQKHLVGKGKILYDGSLDEIKKKYKDKMKVNVKFEYTTDKIKLKESLEDISHQLKTPLTSITIMLDNILESSNMSAETRIEFIKDIKREVLNINFLVQTLLKLSKFDANSIEFTNSEVYVKELLDESMEKLSALCDLKNIKVNISGDNDIKVICDVKWQVEALTNIIKNSIEHSEQNSNIDITYDKNKMYTKIEIKDYGKGIAKEDLPHIFERFYKGKNASSDSVGIGLALAKTIIEKNNGNIRVETEEGKGSKFIVIIYN